MLHFIAKRRLEARKLTVVDATNVQREARKPLVQLAREHDCLPVAIVLDVPARECHERNEERADRQFGPHVVRQQLSQMRRSTRGLKREGFRHIHVLKGVEQIEAVEIERTKLWNDRREETGPFDIIGDVHGCFDELVDLLKKLDYEVTGLPDAPLARHPEGRKVLFVGDLVDRGPKSPEVLKLAMAMVEAETAICVPGNHDVKLMRKLWGKDVRLTHGLAETMQQLEGSTDEFKKQIADFVKQSLVSHYVLDDGRLVVAHAGMKERFQGRAVGASPASLRSMARRPARPTSSGCPSGTTGPPSTAGARWSSTDTRPCPRRSGSTARSASTRAASLAASSPRSVIRSAS